MRALTPNKSFGEISSVWHSVEPLEPGEVDVDRARAGMPAARVLAELGYESMRPRCRHSRISVFVGRSPQGNCPDHFDSFRNFTRCIRITEPIFLSIRRSRLRVMAMSLLRRNPRACLGSRHHCGHWKLGSLTRPRDGGSWRIKRKTSIGVVGAIGVWCFQCHSKRKPKLSCDRRRPLAWMDYFQR